MVRKLQYKRKPVCMLSNVYSIPVTVIKKREDELARRERERDRGVFFFFLMNSKS